MRVSGALVQSEVLDVGELLMNVQRGPNAGPQEHYLVWLVRCRVHGYLRRLEVVM